MLLLLYWGLIVGIHGVNALQFNKLSDGIIVTKGQNMSVIEGEWTLLLTIQEDGIEQRLTTHTELVRRAHELWDIIGIQHLGAFFNAQRRALMKAKIEMVIGADRELQYAIHHDSLRPRRGILDFVGTGLNWAFGTATEAQVKQLQSAVDSARGQQKAIVHNVRELITVVNQTQLEGRDMRMKLAALSTAYDRFVTHESDRWDRFDHNTQLLMMKEYLDSLLWLDTSVWRGVNVIRDMHRSLRAGQLTEQLCPVSLLREIGRLAVTHGLRPLPDEWYYENIRVTPLMIHEGLMTFRVTLPYADDNVYQRYNIRTFAVPIDSDGSRARAAVQPDISIQTASGLWFVPTSCQGHRPQLCKAGPRWRDAYPCERWLITGHEPDRKTCTIVITNTTDTTAVKLSEGTFVLQTMGEDVRLACTGRVQEQATLERGTYTIGLSEGCILSGGRWALHGILRRYLTATATMNQLEVPRLDLLAIMRARPVMNDTDSSVNLNFDNDKYGYVSKYESMDNDGYPEILVAHHLSWTAIGLIIILCVLGGIGGIWLYRRRQKIRFFFADALLARVKAKQVEKAIKYSAKSPESVEIGGGGGASGHDGEDVEEQQIV